MRACPPRIPPTGRREARLFPPGVPGQNKLQVAWQRPSSRCQEPGRNGAQMVTWFMSLLNGALMSNLGNGASLTRSGAPASRSAAMMNYMPSVSAMHALLTEVTEDFAGRSVEAWRPAFGSSPGRREAEAIAILMRSDGVTLGPSTHGGGLEG
jgi:hypothetical protein